MQLVSCRLGQLEKVKKITKGVRGINASALKLAFKHKNNNVNQRKENDVLLNYLLLKKFAEDTCLICMDTPEKPKAFSCCFGGVVCKECYQSLKKHRLCYSCGNLDPAPDFCKHQKCLTCKQDIKDEMLVRFGLQDVQLNNDSAVSNSLSSSSSSSSDKLVKKK